MLRVVPLPRFHGGGQNDIVLAARLGAGVGKSHPAKFPRAPIERVLCASLHLAAKGSGTPKGADHHPPHLSMRRAPCKARPPSGVPPRLSPKRLSSALAQSQAMLPGTRQGTLDPQKPAPTGGRKTLRCSTGVTRVRLSQSSEAPHAPVIVPAGMMPKPPENEADEASPAGTALAPTGRRHRPTSFTTSEIRSEYVTGIETKVKSLVTIESTIPRSIIFQVMVPFAGCGAARSGAPLIRDRLKLGVCEDPGSGYHAHVARAACERVNETMLSDGAGRATCESPLCAESDGRLSKCDPSRRPLSERSAPARPDHSALEQAPFDKAGLRLRRETIILEK
jgi:hypothetical protein